MVVNAKKPAKIEALVVNAIRRLQDVQGSTSREISDYISQEYDIPAAEIGKQVRLTLKRGVTYGILQRLKGGNYTCNWDFIRGQTLASGDGIIEIPCHSKRRRFKSRRRSRRRRRRGNSGRRRSRRRRSKVRGRRQRIGPREPVGIDPNVLANPEEKNLIPTGRESVSTMSSTSEQRNSDDPPTENLFTRNGLNSVH